MYTLGVALEDQESGGIQKLYGKNGSGVYDEAIVSEVLEWTAFREEDRRRTEVIYVRKSSP